MKTNTIDRTHYTTAQAAEKLGKTTGRIRQLARADKLKGAEVFGTGYIIPRSTIDKMAAAAGGNKKPAAAESNGHAEKRKPAAKRKLRKVKVSKSRKRKPR